MTTVKTSELKKAILALEGILPTNYPEYRVWSETLKCALIIFEGHQVLLSATDRRVWLCVQINSYDRFRKVGREKLVIPYNSLVELCKYLTDEEARLIASQNDLEVECAGIAYRLAGIDSSYPEDDSISHKVFQGRVSIQRSELEGILAVCGKYASKNLLKEPLTGIHLLVDGNTAVAEATDGNFGIQAVFPVISCNKFDFVMPASFPQQMLRHEWKSLNIATYYDCIVAKSETGSVNFRCRQIPGLYPSDLLNAKFKNLTDQFDALGDDTENTDDWYWKNPDRPDGDQDFDE